MRDSARLCNPSWEQSSSTVQDIAGQCLRCRTIIGKHRTVQDSAGDCNAVYYNAGHCETVRDSARLCKPSWDKFSTVQDSAKECRTVLKCTMYTYRILGNTQCTTVQNNAGQCKTLQDIAREVLDNARQMQESAAQYHWMHASKRQCRLMRYSAGQWKLCKPSWNRYSTKLYRIMRDSAQHKSAVQCRTAQDFAGHSDWLHFTCTSSKANGPRWTVPLVSV